MEKYAALIGFSLLIAVVFLGIAYLIDYGFGGSNESNSDDT